MCVIIRNIYYIWIFLTNIKSISTYVPINSSHISTPSDQKSTALSWPLLRIISGATYSGVPQNVHVLLPSFITFENPKSTWKFSDKNITRLYRCACKMFLQSLHTSYRIYLNELHNINDGISRDILVSYLPFWHIQKRQVKDFRVSNLCIWFLGYVDNLKIYFLGNKATLI